MARASAEALRGNVPEDLDWHGCVAGIRFAFYNIGWQEADTTKGIGELQNEILGIVVHHQVQVLALCEVLDIDDGRNEQREVARHLVEFVNEQTTSSSAEQPALGTWTGAACDHYMTLWRTDPGFRCFALLCVALLVFALLCVALLFVALRCFALLCVAVRV